LAGGEQLQAHDLNYFTGSARKSPWPPCFATFLFGQFNLPDSGVRMISGAKSSAARGASATSHECARRTKSAFSIETNE